MVPNAVRRRARRHPVVAGPVPVPVAVALLLLVTSACSRRADIKDEPDASTNPGPMAPLDGGIPLVEEAGLEDPVLAMCASRPEEIRCRGDNDFPCDLKGFISQLAEECQNATDCRANGWFAIDLDMDGCAAAVRMEEPNAAFVACVVGELNAYRCPCAAVNERYFLGLGNQGCPDRDCESGEFPCDVGEICVEGTCVPAGAAGTGG